MYFRIYSLFKAFTKIKLIKVQLFLHKYSHFLKRASSPKQCIPVKKSMCTTLWPDPMTKILV